MTLLGYRNPIRRLSRAVRGLFRRPRRGTAGPGFRIFADFEFPGALHFAKRLWAECVSMGIRRRFWSDFRDELGAVLAARDSGRIESVIAWTISDEKALRELAALGVDGILTDDVKLLRRIVGARTKTG